MLEMIYGPDVVTPAHAEAMCEVQRLRGQDIWNGALSALDYERGEIIAYVGSANYYERRRVGPRMQPQFDVLSSGWRQPVLAGRQLRLAPAPAGASLRCCQRLLR